MELETQGTIQGRHDLLIYYEDTDLSGFVYHANYLKFFERAREHLIGIDFLRQLYSREGIHFVVNRAELDFKSPARHGDLLRIVTEGRYSRSPAIVFQQTALVVDGDRERLAVSGQVAIVALNAQNRPIRMPDSIISVFHQRQQMFDS